MKKKKYIDAEKLLAEIERRKKQDVTFRERSILIDIETAITFLQQEFPDADLAAEVDKYLVDNYTNDTDVDTPFLERMFSHDRNDLVKFARHFAEWGANHIYIRKEE